MPQSQARVEFVIFTLYTEEIFPFRVTLGVTAGQAGRNSFAPFLSPTQTCAIAVVCITSTTRVFVADIYSCKPILLLAGSKKDSVAGTDTLAIKVVIGFDVVVIAEIQCALITPTV